MTDPSRTDQRMLQLAHSFPSLRGVLTSWDPQWLDSWASGPAPGSGAWRAAQFVLSVYNPYDDWACGRFDFHRAVGCFDPQHLQALAAWVQAPWYP